MIQASILRYISLIRKSISNIIVTYPKDQECNEIIRHSNHRTKSKSKKKFSVPQDQFTSHQDASINQPKLNSMHNLKGIS